MIEILHIIALILSVFRLTELFTFDRITATIRTKFPSYLWSCPRCVSVWAGFAATGLFLLSPWLNWPFALAYLYLVHLEAEVQRRLLAKGRQMLITQVPEGFRIERTDFAPQEFELIGQQLIKHGKTQI